MTTFDCRTKVRFARPAAGERGRGVDGLVGWRGGGDMSARESETETETEGV